MVEITNQSIRISRGDTAVIRLALSGDETPPGTRMLATLKREASAMAPPVWEKLIAVEDGVGELGLGREETDIAAGTYWWDLRVVLPTGEVRTPFAPQRFEILEVVGCV
ncbi:MAG: hypothetical protein MR842_13285 [Clostridiales bacterium]|nr:hypothetical protein [Clostridiales bacterium]